MDAEPPPEPARLLGVDTTDRADGWTAAGFTVHNGVLRLGGLSIRLGVDGPREGLVGWTLDPAPDGPVDGIANRPAGAGDDGGGTVHANTAVALDHVVVGTPDLDRTTKALEGLGWSARRTLDRPETGRRYRFFVVPSPDGKVLVEVIQPVEPPPSDKPARLWGIAVVTADLDAATALLGPDRCGAPKPALQPGRRIATVRGDALGIAVPLALMSPRP